MKVVRPIISSNGIPYFQMTLLKSHSTSGKEKGGKKERMGIVIQFSNIHYLSWYIYCTADVMGERGNWITILARDHSSGNLWILFCVAIEGVLGPLIEKLQSDVTVHCITCQHW